MSINELANMLSSKTIKKATTNGVYVSVEFEDGAVAWFKASGFSYWPAKTSNKS